MIFNKDGTTQHLLPEKIRPSLQQLHLLGSAKKIWERDFNHWLQGKPFHVILWGPPGCGKTTLAKLLGEASHLPFIMLSAVRDGVKEIRAAIANHNKPPLVFIDEIHRLNRTQQDALLPILEFTEAWIIGATTEPPNTELSAPILSRMRCIYVSALNETEILEGLLLGLSYLTENESQAVSKKKTDFVNHLKDNAIHKIAKMSGGDLRFALNLLENIFYCSNAEEEQEIFNNSLKFFSTKNHYDFVSAMIKSMRGSDPDAALFYAIAALDKGEDPLFILRRCIIFASEDVGNADPQALTLATSAYKAVECVGMPEGRIPLAQCVTYLASTFKSNKAYAAIEVVRKWRLQAEEKGLSIEPPTKLTIKGSQQYQYPHNYENNFVLTDYLPQAIFSLKQKEKQPAYLPSQFGVELRLKQRLSELWDKKNH
jgi:putative ATPase